MEAIILAGGLGTRLRDVLPDLPKPMAPVGGKPFLAILMDQLITAGFNSAVLAVGYKNEMIHDYFGDKYGTLGLTYSVESEPLGTGGAIRQALANTSTRQTFVLNGDTYLELDYKAMLEAHIKSMSTLTIAVRAVPDAKRYGALDIVDDCICGFFEKGRLSAGMINAGVYIVTPDIFDLYRLPQVFSFENDLLGRHVRDIRPLAFQTEGSFLDIGVPEDYARAYQMIAPGYPTG